MDIKELISIYDNERSWVSNKMASIDSYLDRAAYGNACDEQKLTQEYDELEERMEELRKIYELIKQVEELSRLILLIEGNIENIACYPGNNAKIENLNNELEGLEDKKNNLLKQIASGLNVDEPSQNKSNIR